MERSVNFMILCDRDANYESIYRATISIGLSILSDRCYEAQRIFRRLIEEYKMIKDETK